MTTKAPNPFDNFPADGTPEQFFDQAMRALAWLEPHLNDNDVHHDTFVRCLSAYSKLLRPSPDIAEKPVDWTLVVMRQRQIVTMFNKARDAIIATEAIAKAKDHSKSQSERASKHRKMDEDQAKRLAKAFWDITIDGRAAYGGVKALATRFDVEPATIRAIAKKYKPN